MLNILNAEHNPPKNPFVTEPVKEVNFERWRKGEFLISSFTLFIPSSAFIIYPLTISTDLLMFWRVGVNSSLIIEAVSLIFFVNFDKSNKTFINIAPTNITMAPVEYAKKVKP